ncbi:EscU/YscU/HrcU family type III secretion system export apparatus switch protein [Spirochaeta cellobiosiphila]|uniref:EscU/YscU/HrcU family type III secretion system export apparatus switch protein n=1 Tax=Spirochaeta cellobiosiphila TaxID=504483 RepID=UPI0003F83567|nr:EscU/YscU/HrcU family type III secretion system export apparatus switch protein [Spirochaeta cellobiosiphila]
MIKSKAVAIKYNSSWPSPMIIAKGENNVAKKITEIGSKNSITILQDGDTLEKIYLLPIGEYVSQEYFGVFAEVLSFVYSIKKSSE